MFDPVKAIIKKENYEEIENWYNNILKNEIDESWIDIFNECKNELMVCLYKLSKFKNYYPIKNEIFTAFKVTKLTDVRVVLVGQDPYPGTDKKGKPFACGLCFSAHEGQEVPVSLNNIHKALAKYDPKFTPQSASLMSWAEQGILMLNCALTVEKDDPASMSSGTKDIWRPFIGKIFSLVTTLKKNMPVITWGQTAQNVITIEEKGHIKLFYFCHPVKPDFVKCSHFKEVNDYMTSLDQIPINWTFI